MSAPQILGIVNLTADSFSDGGRYLEPLAAIAHADQLRADGADILDLGAASSHPEATSVGAEAEIARLAAVLPALKAAGHKISIDSFEPEVQRWALAQGVDYLNDVNGFAQAEIYPELAAADCYLVVMHAVQAKGIAQRLRGDAATIEDRIIKFFDQRLTDLLAAGVAENRLILDPGMGFFLGDAPEVSLRVLARLDRLKQRFGLPLFICASRKSFLRAASGRNLENVAPMSLTAELWASDIGADYIRTHDVAQLHDALVLRQKLTEMRNTL
jgi:dihydropteroate synthase type 2